ncbi:MAG: hypothetical protein K2J67_07325, partial [Lachnospiraceae bacterium]|nr:hypothetical protein [Lachnospiraceae bacterium]
KFLALDEWNYPVNLLVVIDYAGDYAELIGEWLVALKTGVCPPKMRFVLLEREGVENNKGDSNMREKALTNPMWYERMLAVHSHDDIRAMRYTARGNTGFLELPTLSDDAFKQIITDYAEAANKRLSERDQEEILDYCKTIEQNGQGVSRPRPLILLFIVDAWEQEGEHRRWNIQELLLRIIGRYKEHWKTTLCAGDQSVFLAVQRLLIYATATGGWKTKDPLPEYLQKDYLAVKNFCVTQNKLKQLFRSINEKSSWDDILSPLEPDLIGELFVLDYLQNTTEYQEMITAFHTNSRYWLFIFRCIVDYADVDEYADLFGNGLKEVLAESLIKESPEFYALLLRGLIGKQNKDNALDSLAYLESFALDSRYADNEAIVLEYAKGLFNLACDQEVTEAKKTVEKLRVLVSDSRYVGNEKIVFRYARGLVNLAYNQEITEAEKTVEKLRELVSDSRYRGNEEIVLMYAKGLFNLACDQEVTEAEKTVEKLRGLASDSRYVGNEEIMLEYARGLAILGYKYYLQFNLDMAEKNFSKAYQMGCKEVSVNLCYMIRRCETKMYSPPAIKEILLPSLKDKDPFAIMNMALYLAEYENDWQGADDMIFDSAETADFSEVIEWWSSLDDLEGLLVMTWLERNKICMPQYTLKAKDTLELLRSKYPQVPDWMTEIRE